MSFKKLRSQINLIDEQILTLLEQRSKVSHKIGEYKKQNKLKILDPKRENEIIQNLNIKLANNMYKENIIEIYKKIMDESKKIQIKYTQFEYGVLGENISYTYSPQVHSIIKNITNNKKYNYTKYDINEKDIPIVLKNIQGLNVTIPYKKEIKKYISNDCEYPVNVIVKKQNKIYGYNTDVLALKIQLKEIINNNTKIAILGNSNSAQNIKSALNELKFKNEVMIFSRIGDGQEILEYSKITKYKPNVIINTVPQKYEIENLQTLLIPILKNIKFYLDINYFPGISNLGLFLKKQNIPVENGLKILIIQAIESYKIFMNDSKINLDYEKLMQKFKQNKIILVGLPNIGKTTFGKKLAYALNYCFIDIDQVIEKKYAQTCTKIIQEKGICYFRKLEKEELQTVLQNNNKCIISTGGGIIESQISNLTHNWTVIELVRPINQYLKEYNFKNRPIFKNITELEENIQKRKRKYQEISTMKINISNHEIAMNKIIKFLK